MAKADPNPLAGGSSPGVRLRVPERSQVEMKFESADDLVPAGHPVRVVWAVVSG
jgi:hypothetical protein